MGKKKITKPVVVHDDIDPFVDLLAEIQAKLFIMNCRMTSSDIENFVKKRDQLLVAIGRILKRGR